jgi:hypothetical protein
MDRLKENMDERLKRVEEAKYLLSIKGLGVVTVARFFGEVT